MSSCVGDSDVVITYAFLKDCQGPWRRGARSADMKRGNTVEGFPESSSLACHPSLSSQDMSLLIRQHSSCNTPWKERAVCLWLCSRWCWLSGLSSSCFLMLDAVSQETSSRGYHSHSTKYSSSHQGKGKGKAWRAASDEIFAGSYLTLPFLTPHRELWPPRTFQPNSLHFVVGGLLTVRRTQVRCSAEYKSQRLSSSPLQWLDPSTTWTRNLMAGVVWLCR